MYYGKDTYVYHNGKFVKAKDATTDLYSQTLHYGMGVFEGIRSYNSSHGAHIFLAQEHYERLKYSAEKMLIPFEWNINDLISVTYELLEKNKFTDAYIRPLIYMGANMVLTPTTEANLVIQAWKWGKYMGDDLHEIMISSFERPNPKSFAIDAKVTGQYASSILATSEAKQKGFSEALILDINGKVAEASGANFFYEKDGVLYTPKPGHILPGITRWVVMQIAKEEGIKVIEKEITPEETFEADAAFLTGTAIEIAGIKSINKHTLKINWEDSLGYIIHQKYRKVVSQDEYHKYSII